MSTLAIWEFSVTRLKESLSGRARLARTKLRRGGEPVDRPRLHQNRLYILNDNEDQSFLIALDTKTGAEMWRTLRAEKSSWSTPYVWENGTRTEIVASGSGVVRSYDLDGKLLWHLGDMSGNAIPTPLAGPESLAVCELRLLYGE